MILTGIAAALSLLGDQALYAILPIHYERLGLSALQVGLILSVNRFVRLLTNHMVARLIRHVHFSGLFVMVLVLGAALTFTYGLWPPFAVLIVARLLWGFCWSMIRQIGTMTSIRAAGNEQVGRTVGLYNGLARAGSITGLALGGILFDEIGMKLCFFTLAGISLLGVIPATFAGRALRRMSFHIHESQDGPVPKQSRSVLVCGFILGCAGYGIIFSKLGTVLKMLSEDTVALGGWMVQLTTFVSILLCLRHAVGLFLGPALGRLDDHIGHRRAIVGFFTGATLLLAGAAVFAYQFWIVVALMLVFFVFSTCLMVSLMAEAGRTGSATFAWLATALDFGAATGPLVAWTIGDWVKEPWMPFTIAGGMCLLGAAISLRRLIKLGPSPHGPQAEFVTG